MDCLRCSTPLPPDLDTCPSCGAEAGLVPVRQVADAALLPLLKSVLEAAGVHYVVQGESALGMLPLGPLATGLTANLVAATILVPAHQAEQASELLAGASVPPADGEACEPRPVTDDRTIRFLFDYISPNAYIAWSELGPLAGRYGYRVDPVPVLFAGLLRANNARGPAEIRHKWQWMVHDVVRKCRRLELPLAPPASHPFNPLLALRVTSVDRAPADSRRVIDRLFRAVWAESEDVTSPPVVARLLDEVGIDGAATVLEAGTGEVKSRLRDRTEAAVSRGVFGVPTMLVGSALFWGYDDFPWLERHLGGEEVLDSSDLGGWGRVRPSARRRDAGGREIEPGRR